MSQEGQKHTAEWLRDGNLLYTLDHAGWQKGKEIFRNRLSVRVDINRVSSATEADADELAAQILAFLNRAQSGLVDEPDYKLLAHQFAELLVFCMENLRSTGTGLIRDDTTGRVEPWRKWIARYIEKLPGMVIDHQILEALDLPAKERRKRLAEIAAAKAKPQEVA